MSFTKTIRYNLPDDYLSLSATKKMQAEWTYSGPEKVWVFVQYGTNLLLWTESFKAYAEDISEEKQYEQWDVYTGLNSYPVLINIHDHPILMSILCHDPYDIETLPQKEYKLPGSDVVFYKRPEPTPPFMTYEIAGLTYDPVSKKFSDIPFKSPHVTRESYLAVTNDIIANEESVNTSKFTLKQRTLWNEYLTEAKNITTLYADYLDTPWVIPFPKNPRFDAEIWADEDGDDELVDAQSDPPSDPAPKIIIAPEADYLNAPPTVGIATDRELTLEEQGITSPYRAWVRKDGIWVVGEPPGNPIKYDIVEGAPLLDQAYREDSYITEEEAAEQLAEVKKIHTGIPV